MHFSRLEDTLHVAREFKDPVEKPAVYAGKQAWVSHSSKWRQGVTLACSRNDSRNDCPIDCARGIFNFAFCFEWIERISSTPVAKIKSQIFKQTDLASILLSKKESMKYCIKINDESIKM